MKRCHLTSFVCCWVLLVLWVALPGLEAQEAEAISRSQAKETFWLEATPLDSQQPPTLFEPLPRGAFPLGKLVPGWWLLCSGGTGAGTACERRFLEEEAATFEVRPAAGAAVTGSVLVGREPGAGAEVAVVPAGLPSRRSFTVPLTLDAKRGEILRRVSTGDDGRFRVPPVAPGEYFLEILLPGGRIASSDPFTVPLPETLRPAGESPPGFEPVFELGEILFPRGLSLEVWVTAAAGGPVPHSRVGAGQGYRPEDAVFFETEANVEGKAVLAGLDPTLPMTLTCVAPGYRRHRERFDVPPPAGLCVMEELAAISGQVTDEAESPVDGAAVTLSAGTRSVQTGEDGAFAFTGVAAGVWELRAAAPGWAAARREVELAPGEELRMEPIRLLPGREIEGRVVDAETGEPVSGAAVTVTDPPGGGGTVSGEEGRFQLRAGTAEPLEVSVEASGYARSVETLPPEKLTAGEPVRLTVSRGGRIEVLAWDEQGGPCVGCAVSIQGAGALSSLRTGGDGRAVSGQLAPRRWPVTLVRERGLGSVVKVSGGDDVRWAEVRSGQTVTVRFGEPRQEVVVHFEPPPPPGWRLEVRGRESVEILERQGDGGFPVRREPGEAAELFLLGPLGTSTRVAQGSLPADFDAPQRVLELPQGGARGVLLRGEDPAAAEPAQLFAAAGGLKAVVSTAGDGSFFIPFLPPGNYALAAAGEVQHRFQLAAGRVEDLGRLELAAGEAP